MDNEPKTVLVGNLQKFSIEDGPGIRTTVFMKGCPLKCRWCHNPELIDPQQQLIFTPNHCIGCGYCVKSCPKNAMSMTSGNAIKIDRSKCNICLKCTEHCYPQALKPVAKPMTVEEILRIGTQDKGFYDNTGGGITISGGEILIHAGFVVDLITESNKRGINICIDTCGFGNSQVLKEISLKENVTDILYDIKSLDDEVHIKYTGVSNRTIIDNLKMLASDSKSKDKLTVRMPLIKGINDDDDIIKTTGEFYREIGIERVNLLPYHSLGIGKMKNLGGKQDEFQQPSETRMEEIEAYFRGTLNLRVETLGKV